MYRCSGTGALEGAKFPRSIHRCFWGIHPIITFYVGLFDPQGAGSRSIPPRILNPTMSADLL